MGVIISEILSLVDKFAMQNSSTQSRLIFALMASFSSKLAYLQILSILQLMRTGSRPGQLENK